MPHFRIAFQRSNAPRITDPETTTALKVRIWFVSTARPWTIADTANTEIAPACPRGRKDAIKVERMARCASANTGSMAEAGDNTNNAGTASFSPEAISPLGSNIKIPTNAAVTRDAVAAHTIRDLTIRLEASARCSFATARVTNAGMEVSKPNCPRTAAALSAESAINRTPKSPGDIQKGRSSPPTPDNTT